MAWPHAALGRPCDVTRSLETAATAVVDALLNVLAQGMPFGFVTGTLAAYLASKGYSIAEVAGVTLMAQLPWTFKFIWGPIIDRFDFARHALGRRRPWICSPNR